MSEPLPDTWYPRELPVLRTVIRLLDEPGALASASDVEEATGLPANEVQAALRALASDGLISDTTADASGEILWLAAASGDARRLSGQWPSPDTVADRLLATLEDLAEHGTDPVEKAKARRALDALGSFSRDLLVSVAGAAAGVAMQ